MPSMINSNLNSLNAQNNTSKSQNALSTAITRLSSGLRINSAADDAAGLSIASRMTSQINGLNQAARNANDGISLAQTADGGLSSISDNLQRMRELAVQSANATNSASDRAALQQEVGQLASEIDRVSTQTQFNGINLLDGSFAAQNFQIGANVGQTIQISSIGNARSSALGKFNGFQLTNQSIGVATDVATAQSITAGGTSYALGNTATDAKALAAAITSAGIPGMTVTANATTKVAGTSIASFGATAGTAIYTINGTAISIASDGTGGAVNRGNAISAINAQSSVTGVTASINSAGNGVQLTAADGRNITTSFAAGSTGASGVADFGLSADGTAGGTLNITYSAPAGVSGTVTAAGAFGTALGTQTIASTGTSIAAVDVSTVAGANAALLAVDSALSSVNSSRAQLGAIQNRFTSTVSNLQTSSQNLTASRSRIQDADFAAETANLSRAQVLQQAGTAMIAQANQLPQQVLSLLR